MIKELAQERLIKLTIGLAVGVVASGLSRDSDYRKDKLNTFTLQNGNR